MMKTITIKIHKLLYYCNYYSQIYQHENYVTMSLLREMVIRFMLKVKKHLLINPDKNAQNPVALIFALLSVAKQNLANIRQHKCATVTQNIRKLS